MFRFPSKCNYQGKLYALATERVQKWIQALKRDDLTDRKIKYERVCGKHFISGRSSTLEDKDNPDWVPSLNMGHNSAILSKPSSNSRYQRAKSGESKGEVSLVIDTKPQVLQHNEVAEQLQVPVNATEPEVNIETALIVLNRELYTLRDRLVKFKYNAETFESDSRKCFYYTGLSNIKYVNVVYELVEPFLNDHNTSLKLKYKFEIDRRTGSRCFYNTHYILYRRLKAFLIWPNREILQQTVPLDFKHTFGNKVAAIIDCFEVYIEKPSTVQASSQTFSHYKHHITIKILIGITPCGVIIFIYEAYGGRCSDKCVTENCGLLENLLPGDAILADKGFLIDESVGLYLAEVIQPAFINGRNQLSPLDVEKTRQIANLRIHVERIIGVVRQKYNILEQIIPITILKDKNAISTIDQIVHVCCSLTNLCPPIVLLQ